MGIRNMKASAESTALPAGNFSAWLSCAEASLQSSDKGADVPCGTCKGCCRSSMFVHIEPDEAETLDRIPRLLLFPAPGRPRSHVLMGYNDQGHCPMLLHGKCSIYEFRPRACRKYDCRFFAAADTAVDAQSQPEIARRVGRWVFDYEDEAGREAHMMVKETAAFLKKNGDLFMKGTLPVHPVQLAALAVRIHGVFAAITANAQKDGTAAPPAAIANAIMTALSVPTAA